MARMGTTISRKKKEKGTKPSTKRRSGSKKKSKAKGRKKNPGGAVQPRNVKTLPTWKGDPNDAVKKAAWEKSFEPGYKPQIISPRDKDGKYTSNPEKTVGYITMDKQTHAREIAIALQSEPNVPMSIIDSLKKTLGVVQEGMEEPAPTATTLTKTKGEEETGRTLTSMTKGKFGAMVIAGLVGIFLLLKLGETR